MDFAKSALVIPLCFINPRIFCDIFIFISMRVIVRFTILTNSNIYYMFVKKNLQITYESNSIKSTNKKNGLAKKICSSEGSINFCRVISYNSQAKKSKARCFTKNTKSIRTLYSKRCKINKLNSRNILNLNQKIEYLCMLYYPAIG